KTGRGRQRLKDHFIISSSNKRKRTFSTNNKDIKKDVAEIALYIENIFKENK
ncbi:37192_t:CDS:2, partial [Gigaspora margarita]